MYEKVPKSVQKCTKNVKCKKIPEKVRRNEDLNRQYTRGLTFLARVLEDADPARPMDSQTDSFAVRQISNVQPDDLLGAFEVSF